MDYFGFELYLQGRDQAARTIESQLRLLKIIEQECPEFTLENCQKVIVNKLKLSRACANKYVQTIKNYCAYKGIEWSKNLHRYTEQPKPRVTFTDDEIYRFINLKMDFQRDTNQSRFDMFWKILAYTGMRPGEVVELRAEDISDSIFIRRSKTGSGRIVPIPEPLKDELLSFIQNKDLLFDFTSGGWLLDFKRRIKALGIKKKVTPYSFRHSFATRNVQTSPLFDVMSILGHKKAQTTQMYYHGNLETMEKVVRKDSLSRENLPPAELLKQIASEIEKSVNTDKLDISITKSSNEFSLHIALKKNR